MRCDCHVHIVGPVGRYPQVPERTYLAGPAPVETLKRLAATRGITRFVIVGIIFALFSLATLKLR